MPVLEISPGTHTIFPSIYPPHLLRAIPCSYWASACRAALPSPVASYELYLFLFVGPEVCPPDCYIRNPAFFRFHLTMDTLAFG